MSAQCLLNRKSSQPNLKAALSQQGGQGHKAGVSRLEACEDAFHVKKTPAKCRFPMQTSADGADSHRSTYKALAETSEQVYDCVGLRIEAQVDYRNLLCPNGQPKTCTVQAKHSGVLEKAWIDDGDQMKAMESSIGACLKGDPTALSTNPADICNHVTWCSDAWHLMNSFTGDTAELNWWPGISTIVRKHHDFFRHYAGHFVQQSSSACASCLMFPKPAELICRGLQQYTGLIGELEPLHYDARNMMYHEHGAKIDFTPYLPLPASNNFDKSILEHGRKILLVAGANGFYRAPKHLIDMYSPYLKFDLVYMWDPDANRMGIPESYQDGLEFVQTFLKVGSRVETDLITFMQNHVNEEDYVVLMYDVDEGSNGPTMEWGFLADLVSQERPLVDEFYTELHFHADKFDWSYERHTGREAVELMMQMRDKCGFAVHAWP